MSPPSDLTTRFTLLCLRARWDPAALEAARALARECPPNWDAWHAAVQVEALTPVLYRVVHGQALVPAAVEERLQVDYYQVVRRNLLIFRELGRVLRALAEEKAAVVLLKGAALAETVYGNLALRPMVDLDLLLHRQDMPVAVQVLTKLGYGLTETETQAGAAVAFENEIALHRPGPLDTTIEIHWSLVDSPHYQHKLPMAWFWETAVPVQVDGAGALTLGPEPLLLHLCAHLALHHRGQGLRWLHDIAEVLHFFESRLDWELLLAKAVEYDLVLPLQQIVPRVVEGWGAPAPAGALERLRRLEPSPEEVRVFKWLTADERPVAQRFWADLASTPGWSQRLRYGLGNLFPSPAYMRQRYGVRHGLLLPLYYPYRWLVGLRGAARLVGGRRTDTS
jgi:hypothetical protein